MNFQLGIFLVFF